MGVGVDVGVSVGVGSCAGVDVDAAVPGVVVAGAPGSDVDGVGVDLPPVGAGFGPTIMVRIRPGWSPAAVDETVLAGWGPGSGRALTPRR